MQADGKRDADADYGDDDFDAPRGGGGKSAETSRASSRGRGDGEGEGKPAAAPAPAPASAVVGVTAVGGAERLAALLASSASSSTMAQPSEVPPVAALAGQIYAQYAAPRPAGDLEPPRAGELFAGWNDDTCRTAVLGMSERQLLRRLCVGRVEAAADKVARMYRAFQHVAAGGTAADFSPSNPAADRSVPEGGPGQPPRRIAALDESGARIVLQCMGRADSVARDAMALQRWAAVLAGPGSAAAAAASAASAPDSSPAADSATAPLSGALSAPTVAIVDEKDKPAVADDRVLPAGTDSKTADDPATSDGGKLPEAGDSSASAPAPLPAPAPAPTPPTPLPLSGTVLEFFAVFGFATDTEPVGDTTIRGAASLLRMYAPPGEAVQALMSALRYTSQALDAEGSAAAASWRIEGDSDAFRARLGRFQHGADLLRACGFDEVAAAQPAAAVGDAAPAVSGRTIFLVDSAHDYRGEPLAAMLPPAARARLVLARSELEAEVEMMDGGAPLVSRVMREVEASAITVDVASRAAWLGRMLMAGRTLLRITTNVLANPRDARLWRVKSSSTALADKVRSLGEAHALRLMASVGFVRQADAFVLRGTRDFDAASSVVPRFPGTGGTGAALPFFSFPSISDDVLSFLLRRRSDLEETLFKLEARLDQLGAAPIADALTQGAARNAEARLASDKAAGHGATQDAPAPTLDTAAATAIATPAAATATKPAAGSKGAAAAAAAATAVAVDPGSQDVLLSRGGGVADAQLVIPILVRAQLMAEPGLAGAQAAIAGAASGGAKAPAKKPVGAKGGAAASVGPMTVAVTDPVYEVHLAQLRLLRQAFTRLDTRGTGSVTVADLKAAFAVEARPLAERTPDALQAWIASRDLNGDAAVSWPEFAASFAALFLAPATGARDAQARANATAPAKAAPALKASSAAAAAALNDMSAAKQAAAAAAEALGLARRGFEAELGALAATALAQLQCVMRASLPVGAWQADDGSSASLLALPWAAPVLDTLAGLGLLNLFCDRGHVRSLLTGWAAHVTAVVSEPRNPTLWAFRVTLPHDEGIGGQSSVALSTSSSARDMHGGALATVSADATRLADMTLSWDVARLPGMLLLMRGFGFEPVHDEAGSALARGRGGVPREFRLGGALSCSWVQLPDAQRATMAACAQVVARHATVFEAAEAADPAAALVAVAAVSCGSVGALLRKLALRPPSSAGPFDSAQGGAPLAATGAIKPAGKANSKAPAGAAQGAPAVTTVGPVGAGDPLFDELADGDMALRWRTGLETLHAYVSKAAAAPLDMSLRRINSANAAFRARLAFFPCPAPMHGLHGDAAVLAPPAWEGTRCLAAVGFRETPDGTLVLPPAASIALLHVRELELRAMLPLLNSIVKLSDAKAAAARTLLPPPVATGPSGESTAPASGAMTSRLPTTLLSSVLDPRTAATRRYSETNALRGGDRLAELGAGSTNTSLASGSPLNTSAASAALLNSSFASSAAPGFGGSARLASPTPPPNKALAKTTGVPPPLPALAAHAAPHTQGDKSAKALVALGPAQAGDAVAGLIEESARTAAESKGKISDLEREVAELRSQVRAQQVTDLVPRLKQSLQPLAGPEQTGARSSALVAAAGLGIKIAVALAVPAAAVLASGAVKGGKAVAAKPTDKAKKAPAKTKAPALQPTPLRVAATVAEGECEVLVQARAQDLAAGALPSDEAACLEAGELFVPVQLQLRAGDCVSVATDKGTSIAFVRRVQNAAECERPPDHFRLLLDRPFVQALHEGAAFLTLAAPAPELRKQFERNEIIGMLAQLIPELAAVAADQAEAALRLRAAEGRFAHRSVARRVACAAMIYGEVAEAAFVVGAGRRPARSPIEPTAQLVSACGGQMLVFNSSPPPGSMPGAGAAPLVALATPIALSATADVFAHIFDLVDFGGEGALPLTPTFAARLRREPTAWAVLCCDAVAPVFALDSASASQLQPTVQQVWQRLASVPARVAAADAADAADATARGSAAPPASPLTLTRHVFAALFRPLHTLDFMLADKGSVRLLTYAYAGRVDLLGDAAVDYWGRQWDAARASTPLLTETQLGDLAQAFAQAHTQEALFVEAAWTAMTSGSIVQTDTRQLPRELLTLRGAVSLFFVLDGDAPTEAELFAFACETHAERLAFARRERRRLLDGDGGDSEQADDAEAASGVARATGDGTSLEVDEGGDEDEAPLLDSQGRAIPREPWRGLAFADLVALRVRRDAALVPVSKTAPAPSLAAERRRIFPTPALARLPHVVATLRAAFRDVRRVLLLSILESLRRDNESAATAAARSATVEERVVSVPAADLVAGLQRTDVGRRTLSFPLAAVGGNGVPRGAGSAFVTVLSALEQLGRGCATTHVTWAQLSSAVRSCAASISPASADLQSPCIQHVLLQGGVVEPGTALAPAPSVYFPSLAGRPPALVSLSSPGGASGSGSGSQSSAAMAASAAAASSALAVLDVATSLLTNSVAVLTSDGSLTAYDASSLTRKWVVAALPPHAARAMQWLRQARLPFARLLACAAEAAAPGCAPASTNAEAAGTAPSGLLLLATSPEAHGQVVVNLSAASYAMRLAAEADPLVAAAFTDPADATGQVLLELAWHSDAPACGQQVARVTPRVLADAELWTLGSTSGGQHRVHVAAGTAFALLEFVYLHDAHLLVGSAVPIVAGGPPGSTAAAAATAQFLESEGPHQVPGSATLSWPRLMAFDALTGACAADLGPLSAASTTGCHLAYCLQSCHLVASDVLPLPEAETPAPAPSMAKPAASGTKAAPAATRHRETTPVLKVWDLAPVIAALARQRAAFLQAATSPDRAAAASTSLLATHTSAHLQQSTTLDRTDVAALLAPAVDVDALIPQVLALPHVLLLDVMCQGAAAGTALSPFQPGPPVTALCMLPHSGMLAVAQGDGRLSLWDSHHRRLRLHFPPTCNFAASDYAFSGGAASEDDDDARWTALPRGCYPASSLKLSSYYRPAGLLQGPIAPSHLARAGFDGRLVRELPAPTGASAHAQAVSMPRHIGLAVAPGGLHAALRASRQPCRVRVLQPDAARAGEIAAAFAPLHGRMFPGSIKKRDPDAEADEVLDEREGSGPDEAAGSSATLFAGYIYVLDDGTCVAVESPATASLALRVLPTLLLDRLFDARFVELSDDIYFCAAAGADVSSDAWAALKRVLLLRHRVARVLFVVSKGVPLASFVPALTRSVSITPQGQRAPGSGNSAPGSPNMSVPVAAAPLGAIIHFLAGTHDAANGAAGVAVAAASSITQLCTPVSDSDGPPLAVPPVAALPPFVCLPFFALGDSSSAVMALRLGGNASASGSALFEASDAVQATTGRCFTTGFIVALSSNENKSSDSDDGIAEVALEWEDRLVRVRVADIEVLVTAAGVTVSASPGPGEGSGGRGGPVPRIGDRVLLSVRPASVEATLTSGEGGGDDTARVAIGATRTESERLPFPSAFTLLPEPPSPGIDVLIVHCDAFAEPSGGTVRVRRSVQLWAVGSAEATVTAPRYVEELPPAALRAIDAGFLRHAGATLLRQQAQWAGASSTALRRSAVRAAIITSRALALYDAANSGRGVGPTAGALFRAANAVGCYENDAAVPTLRAALGHVWGLVELQLQMQLLPHGSRGGARHGRVSLLHFLTTLVAAAWHYPWFRFALKPLLSLTVGAGSTNVGADGRLSLFSVASACMPAFKRHLLAESGGGNKGGGGGNDGESLRAEAVSHLSFGNVLDAAARTLRDSLTIDSLLGVLEYLRDAGGLDGGGSGGAAAEHMVQSLVRRRALPWDPQQMLVMGLADGATVEALSSAGVVPTPLDQFLPAEAAFLLADAPNVCSVTEPTLLALAKAFADPVVAMKTTLQAMLQRSIGLHLQALVPEDGGEASAGGRVLAALEDGSDNGEGEGEDDDAEVAAGAGPLMRLARAEVAAAGQLAGTAYTLLVAHSRLVALTAAVLGDGVIPKYAKSMQQALGQAARKRAPDRRSRSGQQRSRDALRVAARLQLQQGEQARLRAATQALMARVHALLERAPLSCSPLTGADTSWLGGYLAACKEFASLVETAAHEDVAPMSAGGSEEPQSAEDAAAARDLVQSRSHSQLLSLLSQGCLEALVQCAALHTGYAVKLPSVPRRAAGAAIAGLAEALERLLAGALAEEEPPQLAFEGDDPARRVAGVAARRMAPHLPRLLRALVYLSTGRLDGVADDISADTTSAAPVLHPVDSKMLQPAYVAVAAPHCQPLLLHLFGVDGRGSLAYPAVRRYVAACGSAASLARGPALPPPKAMAAMATPDAPAQSSAATFSAGSPLVPLAVAPIVAAFSSSYLPGLQRAATASDMLVKTGGNSAGVHRRVVSWSFEESVEQFAKRFMPIPATAGQMAAVDDDTAGVAAENASRGATASGILAMATTGSPHLISSFCTFRRSAAYWRQLVPCLVALAKLHDGIPDPVLDLGGGGAGDAAASAGAAQALSVGAHARLMERVGHRRLAMARFRLVLRPPEAMSALSATLAAEFDGAELEEGGGSGRHGKGGAGAGRGDAECSDIDRALLAVDLQLHDLTAGLLFDPDLEVRLMAFRAARAVAVAVAGPALEVGGLDVAAGSHLDLTAELAAAGGGASSASSFASRARQRCWSDLLQRFSQPDVVVAASRRVLAYLGGAATATSHGTVPAESYEVISHAVDLFAAQAAMRTALPSAWRMCGVLGILARLAKLGLPRMADREHQDSAKVVGKKPPNGAKSKPVPHATPSAPGATDRSYADVVLRRLCRDHGNEALLALCRYDQAVHAWAEGASVEGGAAQELLFDTSGAWPAVCDSLHHALAGLRTRGLLEALAAAAQVLDKGARQAFLDPPLAAAAGAVFGRLAAQAGSLRRALALEMEMVVRGRPSEAGHGLPLVECVVLFWELAEAAWGVCGATPPGHPARAPTLAFLQSVLSLLVGCTRHGPVQLALALGCRPTGDPAAGAQPWRGLALLCRVLAFAVHPRTHEPDGARFVQARAALLLGAALGRALDLVSLPSLDAEAGGQPQSDDLLASHRAAVDRRYSLTLLAQAGDAGIVEAFAGHVAAHASVLSAAFGASPAAAVAHMYMAQGQALAVGIRGRSLLWAALLRCALLQLPRGAAGSSAGGRAGSTSLPAAAFTQLSRHFAQHICASGVFRSIFCSLLPSARLLDGGASLPPALAAFEGTFPLRTEGVAMVYCAGALMLQRASLDDARTDGTGGGGETEDIADAMVVPDTTAAADTIFQATLRGGAESGTGTAQSRVALQPPLRMLQEHIARVAASDGVVAAERARLWSLRDLALAPTGPPVLQGLLMCAPRDENLRSALEESGLPLAAVVWYRASRRYFLAQAASADDVSVTTAAARTHYARAEAEAGAAWAAWRVAKLHGQPRAAETEAARAVARGAAVPPPALPADGLSARAALTGRFLRTGGPRDTVDDDDFGVVTTARTLRADTGHVTAAVPPQPPQLAPTALRLPPAASSLRRSAPASTLLAAAHAAAVNAGGSSAAAELVATAGRRMTRAARRGRHAQPQPSSQREAVAATADVLARLGEHVVDVKAAFDTAALPGGDGNGGEAAVPATDRALGGALRSLGLACDSDMLARLEGEGLLVGVAATFSQFLRLVGRVMQLLHLEDLAAVLPSELAAAEAAAKAADPAAAPAVAAAAAPVHQPAAVVHGQELGGPLFRADAARRLTLPPVPVPKELLRSIFERFATARMVVLPASPGRGAEAGERQGIVRGLPFSSWTAALAGAGVPVAPSEARELFRFLHLSLGEIVSLEQLRDAYLAIAGFRFLVMSGLYREGSDMYALVVEGGRDVSGQLRLSARDVPQSEGGDMPRDGADDDDAYSDVSDDVEPEGPPRTREGDESDSKQ